MGVPQELLSQLEEARSELMAALQGLPEDKMTAPMLGEWSVKDILIHIAAWDEVAVQDLRRVARGRVPTVAAIRGQEDIDRWNGFLVAARRPFPMAQVLAELEENRASLRQVLAQLPDALFGEGQLGRTFCEIPARHEREHAQQIRSWRQEQGL